MMMTTNNDGLTSESSDQRNVVNYDPSGNSSSSSIINSGQFGLVDTGIPIHNNSKLDQKPLLINNNNKLGDNVSSKGSILSTGLPPLLDRSVLSHRSIVNLYSEYKQNNDKTVRHKLSFLTIIVTSILWISCWCGVLFLPLAMIIFGILFRNSCPSIPELPGLLIFMGVVTTLNNVVNVVDHLRNLYMIGNDQSPNDRNNSSSRLSTFSFVLNFVTTILIIYLAVIVFKHPSTSTSADETSADFCSPVIYNFASWIIYLIGLLCLFILCAILLGCCYILWKPSQC